jgi:ArsR family transcriptional regulator, lead/cadmium/zinc/bismuth-responsive transcriptional repressor
MHLVPADRAGRRVIDDHRVCDAIAAIGDPHDVARWAGRFAVLADPGRLTLLLSIHAAAPISVTDLSVATGMSDTAVSQALRLLRAHDMVIAERAGRVVRYRLTDSVVHEFLHVVRPPDAVRSHQD